MKHSRSQSNTASPNADFIIIVFYLFSKLIHGLRQLGKGHLWCVIVEKTNFLFWICYGTNIFGKLLTLLRVTWIQRKIPTSEIWTVLLLLFCFSECWTFVFLVFGYNCFSMFVHLVLLGIKSKHRLSAHEKIFDLFLRKLLGKLCFYAVTLEWLLLIFQKNQFEYINDMRCLFDVKWHAPQQSWLCMNLGKHLSAFLHSM